MPSPCTRGPAESPRVSAPWHALPYSAGGARSIQAVIKGFFTERILDDGCCSVNNRQMATAEEELAEVRLLAGENIH